MITNKEEQINIGNGQYMIRRKRFLRHPEIKSKDGKWYPGSMLISEAFVTRMFVRNLGDDHD